MKHISVNLIAMKGIKKESGKERKKGRGVQKKKESGKEREKGIGGERNKGIKYKDPVTLE